MQPSAEKNPKRKKKTEEKINKKTERKNAKPESRKSHGTKLICCRSRFNNTGNDHMWQAQNA